MDAQTATQHLSKVRDQNPLVHSITNNVVTNFTANGLLALGASPVMAYAIEEATDMAKIAGALVLNIGTLSSASVEAMIAAGKSANENGVPVIFDPVGAGATPFRTASARKIIQEVRLSAIRGNAAEIANIAGAPDWKIKGVDAGGSRRRCGSARKDGRKRAEDGHCDYRKNRRHLRRRRHICRT